MRLYVDDVPPGPVPVVVLTEVLPEQDVRSQQVLV